MVCNASKSEPPRLDQEYHPPRHKWSAMSDHSSNRVTVWVNDDIATAMDDEYIDWRYESRSQWVREAIQTRMLVEDALATQGIALPDDEATREEVLRTVIRRGVAAAGDDLPTDE